MSDGEKSEVASGGTPPTYWQQRGIVTYGNLRFWAERGQIHCEDKRDGRYDVIRTKTMVERLVELRIMVMWRLQRGRDREQAMKDQKFLTAMIDVIKEAKHQGSPYNPEVRAEMRARGPSQIAVPSSGLALPGRLAGPRRAISAQTKVTESEVERFLQHGKKSREDAAAIVIDSSQ